MKGFIITTLLSIAIASFLSTLNIFNLKQDPAQTTPALPFNVSRKITTTSGTIGCLTEDSFKEIAQASAKKDSATMKKIMDLGLCVYFAQGVELLLQKGACEEGSKDSEIFVSIPQKMTSQFYMTCSVLK